MHTLDGTYYSSPCPINMNLPDCSTTVQTGNQFYLAPISTRAVIVIDADNPVIGQVFFAMGMVEVSTREILVKEGTYVRKGGQLGMFHHGGSPYCLIFKEGVDLTGFPDIERKENVPVRGKVAVVMRGSQTPKI
ncbi:hypothetical protein ETB97_009347 [Aspergillus alliaceus]|uniref:Phosphatidylserine decarboxylase n=1 Tax=Petromyces alliaceus TaxID=209559 RepID=A0A8H5ZU67_PETAA|nr:hypothetical protein ETB97_009347 [Aspergillus burnettii]